jgi:hypothetical protein
MGVDVGDTVDAVVEDAGDIVNARRAVEDAVMVEKDELQNVDSLFLEVVNAE